MPTWQLEKNKSNSSKESLPMGIGVESPLGCRSDAEVSGCAGERPQSPLS